MAIILRRPTVTDQPLIEKYRNAFLPAPDGIHGSSNLTSYEKVEDWVKQCELDRHKETVQNGWMPAEQYIAIDEQTNEIVGMVNLRKELNDYLLNYFGHIGYSVLQSRRQQGIGTLILQLTLNEARRLGLQRVLLACYESNLASIKVIENNGGVFEDKRLDPVDEEFTCRYWIDLTK